MCMEKDGSGVWGQCVGGPNLYNTLIIYYVLCTGKKNCGFLVSRSLQANGTVG
jgi:hypothetical protein